MASVNGSEKFVTHYNKEPAGKAHHLPFELPPSFSLFFLPTLFQANSPFLIKKPTPLSNTIHFPFSTPIYFFSFFFIYLLMPSLFYHQTKLAVPRLLSNPCHGNVFMLGQLRYHIVSQGCNHLNSLSLKNI